MKRLAVLLLVVVAAGGAFMLYPRGDALAITNGATLTVLHGQVDARKTGGNFAPAFDGDLLAGGDAVRTNEAGNAVITFFDGSTLTVASGAEVKVASLVKTSGGGIQLVIEQAVGRTWASVPKLTGDGSFEIKTPTLTASVRGTAFETTVEVVSGLVTTTVRTTEGVVVVQAQAGGQTTVGAGQQVSIAQGVPAPANPSSQAPSSRLRFTPSANVGLTVIDPRGLQCGAGVRQIPGCDPSGPVISINGPASGTYSIALTAAGATPGATLTLDGGRGVTSDFSTKLTTNLAAGDLVRSTVGVTVPPAGPLSTSGFAAAEPVTSICGAEAKGRVFSAGSLEDRANALAAYAKTSAKQPAAIVYSAGELAKAAADGTASAKLPVPVSGLGVTIDSAGVHLAAQASAGPITVRATAAIIASARDGKLSLKTRDLDLGPIPGSVKDQLVAALDKAFADFGASIPLVVDRVAFRNGCMAVIGTTPP